MNKSVATYLPLSARVIQALKKNTLRSNENVYIYILRCWICTVASWHFFCSYCTRVLELLMCTYPRIFRICAEQNSNTPLHLACAKGHDKVVCFLLDARASLKARWFSMYSCRILYFLSAICALKPRIHLSNAVINKLRPLQCFTRSQVFTNDDLDHECSG